MCVYLLVVVVVVFGFFSNVFVDSDRLGRYGVFRGSPYVIVRVGRVGFNNGCSRFVSEFGYRVHSVSRLFGRYESSSESFGSNGWFSDSCRRNVLGLVGPFVRIRRGRERSV